MRLDQLTLVLRRRSTWEALDLGGVMLRRWSGPIYRAWFATYVPFSLLVLLLLWQSPNLAMVLIWWLKPAFDRVLLKVIAESSFGAPPTVREVWRALPQLLRRSGLIAGLTLRRFSMSRAFDLSVWQLEGQKGKAARSRIRVLSRKVSGENVWLTFFCANAVMIFEFGLIALIEILRPSGAPPFFDLKAFFSGEMESWQALFVGLTWIVGETLVEPFFVAGGFALYLNRRSELEGWDIEVAFRRMAERQAQANATRVSAGEPGAGIAVLALCAALSALSLAPPPAQAQDQPTPAAPAAPSEAAVAPAPPATVPVAQRQPGTAARRAQQVLADPVFGQTVPDWEWRPMRKADEAPPDPKRFRWLLDFINWIAEGFRIVLYVLVALAVAVAIVLIYRARGRLFGDGAARGARPTHLFGLDLRPESLPDDIPAAAQAALEAGQFRLALSLLYRGSLVSLIHERQVEFRPGDTEDVCLHRARNALPAEGGDYFARLLEAWKRTAYAHLPPEPAPAVALCREWRRHFAADASA